MSLFCEEVLSDSDDQNLPFLPMLRPSPAPILHPSSLYTQRLTILRGNIFEKSKTRETIDYPFKKVWHSSKDLISFSEKTFDDHEDHGRSLDRHFPYLVAANNTALTCYFLTMISSIAMHHR